MKSAVVTQRDVNSCEEVYLIVYRAGWHVHIYRWTGGFVRYNNRVCPVVWIFDSSSKEYESIPIYCDPTGFALDWTFDRAAAEKIVAAFNRFGE